MYQGFLNMYCTYNIDTQYTHVRMYTLHDCNKHPHKTQGTFSLGMDIHHIQYVLHYIIIGPLTHITYKYTLYGTFHKKPNNVGWLSSGQHPTVNGQSAVGQRSVNGLSRKFWSGRTRSCDKFGPPLKFLVRVSQFKVFPV